MREIERAALALHERGANVLPLHQVDDSDLSKKPAMPFKRWMKRPQTADDVMRLFHRHAGNIGALGGVHSQAIPDAGHMAFIDCDTARTFDMVGALIKARCGETLTAKSARGGHYWIRTDEPIKTHGFEGGELRGRGAYVAAPPSLHPSGIEYKWLDADTPILRVNELAGLTFEVVPAERLPRLAARILAGDERAIGRYQSRSEVDFALMCSLVNSGYSFTRIVSLFQSSRHESHLDASKSDYLKRLEAEYLRAREFKHADSFVAAREFTGQVRQWALNAYSITGNIRTHETDRRVLIAHCDVAFKTGKLEWHMSQRDIEKDAKISSKTAVNTGKRLQDAEIIVRSQAHQTSYATKWTFGSGACSQLHHSHTLSDGVCVSDGLYAQAQAYLHHATFEHSGLGRNIARTFVSMVDTPLSESEIVSATGWRPKTVARHLESLLRYGLAAIRAGCKWQALPANLDDAAYALRTTDIAHKRAKRIERERNAHRRQLARLQPSAHQHFQPAPASEVNV